MGNIRRQRLLNVFKLFDMAIMVAAFGAAAVLMLRASESVTVKEFFEMRVKIGNFLIFASLLVVWHLLFSTFGLYASRRLSRRSAEIVDSLKATFFATLLLGVGAVVFHITMATPLFMTAFWVLSSFLMVLSRLILRWLLAQTRRHGRNLRDLLIVGTNSRAVGFAKSIQSKPELGYRIIGFADQEWDGMKQFRETGYRMVCSLDELPSVFRKTVVDEVLIALPIRSFHDDAARIATLCEEQGILFRLLPNLFDLKRSRHWTEELEGQSLVTHHNGISEGWQLILKRVLDFVIALTAILLLSPVLLGTAILLALTRGGPVFSCKGGLV
jgi:FlaA1/EpsC-like NDP-sugar epimerase